MVLGWLLSGIIVEVYLLYLWAPSRGQRAWLGQARKSLPKQVMHVLIVHGTGVLMLYRDPTCHMLNMKHFL